MGPTRSIAHAPAGVGDRHCWLFSIPPNDDGPPWILTSVQLHAAVRSAKAAATFCCRHPRKLSQNRLSIFSEIPRHRGCTEVIGVTVDPLSERKSSSCARTARAGTNRVSTIAPSCKCG